MFTLFPTLTETETNFPNYERAFVTETGERVEFALNGTTCIIRWNEGEQFVRLIGGSGRVEHTDRRPVYGPRVPAAPTYRRPVREGRVHFDRFGEYAGRY